MKIKEWLESKKTKDMILTMVLLIVAGYLQLPEHILYMIAAVGGVKIGGQAAVDAKKAANGG